MIIGCSTSHGAHLGSLVNGKGVSCTPPRLTIGHEWTVRAVSIYVDGGDAMGSLCRNLCNASCPLSDTTSRWLTRNRRTRRAGRLLDPLPSPVRSGLAPTSGSVRVGARIPICVSEQPSSTAETWMSFCHAASCPTGWGINFSPPSRLGLRAPRDSHSPHRGLRVGDRRTSTHWDRARHPLDESAGCNPGLPSAAPPDRYLQCTDSRTAGP